MERFVIRQNIEHYRALLKVTPDPAERRRIEKLLLDEEAKLKKYDEDKKTNNRRSPPALVAHPFLPSSPRVGIASVTHQCQTCGHRANLTRAL